MSWNFEYDGHYVSAGERKRRAEAMLRKLAKGGRKLSPVRLAGTVIAKSFWGKAWCKNLESYGSYASRLPRGRSYVRNGAVLDLQVKRGAILAVVNGTEVYDVRIAVAPLGAAAWQAVKAECAGKVGSLIDLLRGKLSAPVMEVITRKGGGLFPKPAEITLDCSCPDGADMCKHLAAVLYGVGARLDESPELLFTLRGVDEGELFSESTRELAAPGEGGTLEGSDLAAIFGIELDGAVAAAAKPAAARKPPKRAARKPGKAKDPRKNAGSGIKQKSRSGPARRARSI